MNTQIATTNGKGVSAQTIESVLLQGDLSKLNPELKLSYYNRVCESLGLNPLTQPFAYISLSGKEVLYAKRDATEQLRKIHGVSIKIVARELVEDLYVVTAQASDKAGRYDESIGAVNLGTLKGEARANGIMKAETKAKRRVTLSICGLGLLDETEVDSIPGARVVESPSLNIPEIELGDSYAAQLEPPKTTIEPLDNPWLFKIARNNKTKTLVEIHQTKPEWFRNILARYQHGQMTEEEYVNAKAAIENPELGPIAEQILREEKESAENE